MVTGRPICASCCWWPITPLTMWDSWSSFDNRLGFGTDRAECQMSEDLWSKVDTYIANTLVKADDALDAALSTSEAAGLPAINVSPSQGKLLHILARLVNARAILEIGTLGGYSTIWMARALQPGGRLITLEFEPKHAELAQANIARAGLHRIVDVRVGAALETLPKIAA